MALAEASDFEAVPGLGVKAVIDGRRVAVGSRRLIEDKVDIRAALEMEADGKTLLYVSVDGGTAGVLAASDTLREEVPEALRAVGWEQTPGGLRRLREELRAFLRAALAP